MASTVTLRTKLLVSFLAVTIITVFVGMFAASKMEQMEEADLILYTRSTEPMKDLVSMMENFMKMRMLLRDITLDEEIKDFKPYLDEITTMRSTFSANLKNVALPGFPWVADLLMSFPEGTNEGYGPIFSDSGADRALVC